MSGISQLGARRRNVAAGTYVISAQGALDVYLVCSLSCPADGTSLGGPSGPNSWLSYKHPISGPVGKENWEFPKTRVL